MPNDRINVKVMTTINNIKPRGISKMQTTANSTRTYNNSTSSTNKPSMRESSDQIILDKP